MEMKSTDDLVPAPEAARLLGITRGRIWQLIVMEKTLPATQLGDRWFVLRHDLDDYKLRQSQKASRVGRPSVGQQWAT